MERIIKTFLLLIFIVSCKGNEFFSPVIDDTCNVVSINTNNDSAYFNCITDITFIPLEVNEKSIYLNNPVMLNPNDSTIVLIDKRNGMMLGYVNCKNSFGRRYIGRGRGEFIEFGNAFVYNDLIGIYDCSTARCLYYNTDGDYVKQIVLEGRYCDEFYQKSNDYSVGFSLSREFGNGDDFCNVYNNTSGKIIHSELFLSRLHSEIVSHPYPVSTHNGKISFYIPYGYVIFEMDSTCNDVFQKYYLDFNDKLEKSLVRNKLNSSNLFAEVLSSGASGNVTDFYETNRYYSFSTIYERTRYKVLIDKKLNQSYAFDTSHGRKKNDSFINQLFMTIRPIGSYNNDVYMYCDYKSFCSIEDNCSMASDSLKDSLIMQIQKYREEYTLDDATKLLFKISFLEF
jgi:hypothetical protein